MRDLDANPYTLEERIKRRILTEGYTPELGTVSHETAFVATAATAARVAALEAEDSANPIAQTQQVRPDLRLNIDVTAFQAVYDDLDHE